MYPFNNTVRSNLCTAYLANKHPTKPPIYVLLTKVPFAADESIVGIYIVLSYVVKPSTYFPFVAYYSSLLML